LTTAGDSLTIRIRDPDDRGIVFAPIIERYHDFVVRGHVNDALLVDIILDTTSDHQLTVTSQLLEFFTQKSPTLRLSFCGHSFSFSRYAVVSDPQIKDLIVVLNPAALRNVDIMFDSMFGGRVGLRKVWTGSSLVSV